MKVLLTLLVAAALALTAAPAQATYMYLSECKDTLSGQPSTNDHDNNIAVRRALTWWPGVEWNRWWGDYYRANDNDVRITVWLEYVDGRIVEIRQRCDDANHTGQVSSEEDYTMWWDPYNFNQPVGS